MIVIALPTYSRIEASTVETLFELQRTSKHELRLVTLAGCADVGRARSVVAHEALTRYPTASHVLWVDDDVSFAPELVDRLVEADRDFIVAPVLAGDGRLPLFAAKPNEAGPIIEVTRTGLAIALMKRVVLERTMDRCTARYAGLAGPVPAIFQPDVDEAVAVLGEDFSFCERWRATGGQIYALVDARTVHAKVAPIVYDGSKRAMAQPLPSAIGITEEESRVVQGVFGKWLAAYGAVT